MKKNTIGVSLHHVAIQTKDFEKAFRFYSEVLGLTVIKKPFNFKGTRTLAWFKAGKLYIELFTVKLGKEPQQYCDRSVGATHIAFETKDLNGFLAHIKQHGITILKEPFLPPTDNASQPKVSFIEGPDGEEIEVREFSTSI